MQTPGPGPWRAASLVGNPKRVEDLDVIPSEDGCMISRPGQPQLHFLNPTAVLVLELCTGERSADEIVDLVKHAYNLQEAPVEDVRAVLRQLKAQGLVV
jgi:hypothetical protein